MCARFCTCTCAVLHACGHSYMSMSTSISVSLPMPEPMSVSTYMHTYMYSGIMLHGACRLQIEEAVQCLTWSSHASFCIVQFDFMLRCAVFSIFISWLCRALNSRAMRPTKIHAVGLSSIRNASSTGPGNLPANSSSAHSVRFLDGTCCRDTLLPQRCSEHQQVCRGPKRKHKGA